MKRYLQLGILLLVPILGVVYFSAFQSFYSKKEWAVPFKVFQNPGLEIIPVEKNGAYGDQPVRFGFSDPITVVHFWASWCPPCVEEFPALVQLQKGLEGSGVRFLYVTVDDKPEAALAFLRKIGVETAIGDNLVWDPAKAMAQKWGSLKFPETYVVASNGWVVEKIIGLQQWMRPSVEEYFRNLGVKYRNRVDGN